MLRPMLGLRTRAADEQATQDDIDALTGLAEVLEAARGRDVSIAFDPDFAREGIPHAGAAGSRQGQCRYGLEG